MFCSKNVDVDVECFKDMKKWVFILLVISTSLNINAQTTVVKTNVLGWAATNLNIAGETKISDKWTVGLNLQYNPFTYSDNKKWKHISVAPELRYWLCSPYAGHFVGGNLVYAHYNMDKVDLPFGQLPALSNGRMQGDLGGIGVFYGYSWILSPRWSVEAEVGLGYGITHYKQYECGKCGTYTGEHTKGIILPPKLAISFVYNLW